jgi:hypothetical protein
MSYKLSWRAINYLGELMKISLSECLVSILQPPNGFMLSYRENKKIGMFGYSPKINSVESIMIED